MDKILIFIANDTINISSKEDNTTIFSDFTKTDVINSGVLTFSKNYILENQKLIGLFIQEMCQEKNLYRVSFETQELAILTFPLFKKNPYITAICIRDNNSLTYQMYEKIIENKNIKYVEANSIPEFLIELLDKKNIRTETRTEIFYPSHFMQSNNLISVPKIFYKMNVRIDKEFLEDDMEDFMAFCKLNKYLKAIHIDKLCKADLEWMIQVLIENRIKNIKFLIYDNIKDYKVIEYLKKLNKKIKKNKLCIELVYSKDYLEDNIFSQIILNTLKVCGLIMLVIVAGIISYISISNYVAFKEVAQIQENVKNKIESNTEEELPSDIPENEERVIKNSYLVSLMSMNKDVVGWLKVNETNIDYPVVQASDNDYYLKHNLDNEEDKNGWIFMDYRNSKYNLDKNTIIFGHNMYYSGIMFGTLANVTKKSWYENPDNLIISYDTIYESNKYQIFSIYKIPKTSDYLKTYFSTDAEFSEFIDMIKSRSMVDFGVSVTTSDSIITLSTCSNYNDRLVVHAKLITN